MTNVIDVHGLVKTYGGKRVVDNVSMAVRTGEIVGFLGPNGSGKTTTIRMMCGLLHADSGGGTVLGYAGLALLALLLSGLWAWWPRGSWRKALRYKPRAAPSRAFPPAIRSGRRPTCWWRRSSARGRSSRRCSRPTRR